MEDCPCPREQMAKITSPSSTAISADVVRQAVGEKYREIKRMRALNYGLIIALRCRLVKKGNILTKCCSCLKK